MTASCRWSSVAALAVVLAAACTHPPSPPATATPSAGGPSPPADCDDPLPANEPEGCIDDSVRPPNATPAERPGTDRDGDGVEDLLDVCPDQPAAPGTDPAGDGCPDA